MSPSGPPSRHRKPLRVRCRGGLVRDWRALACIGGAVLGAVVLAGAFYFGVVPPPGLTAEDSARLAWARRFDEPVARAAAEWAVEQRVADPRLRVAAEWAITHQMDYPGRQSAAE